MKVKPLGNRVLVKRSKAQTTKGGIILPDTAQEKPKEGKLSLLVQEEMKKESFDPLVRKSRRSRSFLFLCRNRS